MEKMTRSSATAVVAFLAVCALDGCALAPAQPDKGAAVSTAAEAPVSAAASDEKVGMPTPTHAQHPASVPEPTVAEIAAGLQVTRIASTAQGGMVDARFRILDPAKVAVLLGNMASQPKLVVDGKPPLMAPHSMMKGGRLSKDQIIAILYPNARTAVKPGESVMVVLGSVQLGPFVAQ